MKVVLLFVALAFGGSALAATPKEPAKRKRIDLIGSELSTRSIDPHIDTINGRPKQARPSLIEVRKDFVPELMRSAE